MEPQTLNPEALPDPWHLDPTKHQTTNSTSSLVVRPDMPLEVEVRDFLLGFLKHARLSPTIGHNWTSKLKVTIEGRWTISLEILVDLFRRNFQGTFLQKEQSIMRSTSNLDIHLHQSLLIDYLNPTWRNYRLSYLPCLSVASLKQASLHLGLLYSLYGSRMAV